MHDVEPTSAEMKRQVEELACRVEASRDDGRCKDEEEEEEEDDDDGGGRGEDEDEDEEEDEADDRTTRRRERSTSDLSNSHASSKALYRKSLRGWYVDVGSGARIMPLVDSSQPVDEDGPPLSVPRGKKLTPSSSASPTTTRCLKSTELASESEERANMRTCWVSGIWYLV